jgi:hypothetical protein
MSELGIFSVLCSHRKASASLMGNHLLKLLINKYLKPYSEARTKIENFKYHNGCEASVPCRVVCQDG